MFWHEWRHIEGPLKVHIPSVHLSPERNKSSEGWGVIILNLLSYHVKNECVFFSLFYGAPMKMRRLWKGLGDKGVFSPCVRPPILFKNLYKMYKHSKCVKKKNLTDKYMKQVKWYPNKTHKEYFSVIVHPFFISRLNPL